MLVAANTNTNAVSITIGGVPASGSFSRAAAALLYRINVTVPVTLHGDQVIKATVIDIATREGPVATVQ